MSVCVCVSRCGVRSKDDHYRWQTDQTADLGYGNIFIVYILLKDSLLIVQHVRDSPEQMEVWKTCTDPLF